MSHFSVIAGKLFDILPCAIRKDHIVLHSIRLMHSHGKRKGEFHDMAKRQH